MITREKRVRGYTSVRLRVYREKMSWLHRLQQRLSITRNEALTLLSLSLFLLVGSAGRYACRQISPVSPEYYAEFDSLFAHRSSAVLGPESENITEIGPVGEPSPPGNVSPPPQTSGHALKSPPQAHSGRALKSPPQASGRALKLPPRAPGHASKSSPQDHSASEPKPASKIDLNSAAMSDLEQLPRVGPKIAERIIAFRDAYGPFRSVDELSSVSGIGPKTLELIRPHAIVIADSAR